MKLSKFNEAEKVDANNFKSLVGSLRYLMCTNQAFYMLLDSSVDTWRLQPLLISRPQNEFFVI